MFKFTFTLLFIVYFFSGILFTNNLNYESKLNDFPIQTLKGEIYEEGTATISNLIFKTDHGQNYLIVGETKEVLRKLQGLSLILTARVKESEKGFSKLEVYDYNTYYQKQNKFMKEVTLLGRLIMVKEDLFLLTKDQQVIKIAKDSYHSLQEYVNKKVVLTGSLQVIGEYQGFMILKSYLII